MKLILNLLLCKLSLHRTNVSAFGVSFLESSSAAAAAVALDEIDPNRNILKHSDEIAHVAEWKRQAEEQWDESVPRFVQTCMARVFDSMNASDPYPDSGTEVPFSRIYKGIGIRKDK